MGTMSSLQAWVEYSVVPSTSLVFSASSGDGYTSPVGMLLAAPWRATDTARGAAKLGDTNASWVARSRPKASRPRGSAPERDLEKDGAIPHETRGGNS